MTNDQGAAAGPSDELTDVRTMTVLPGQAAPADLADRDIREFVPTQRTPGSGPFGPGEVWDVMERREFIEGLEARMESGEPLAIVAFGMDGFQELNLSAGLEAGDIALRNAYRVLRWTLGPSNVAYFGSDCYAALLPYDEATPGIIEAALARLARTDLSDRLTSVFATASAGMVVVDEEGVTVDAVLYEAECSMLSAKEMGGNRVVVDRVAAPYLAVAESA